MAVPLVVPDASVLLNWVLPADEEPNADKARLLRGAIAEQKVQALVPSLWLYEVAKTAARRFPSHARALTSALLKFGLQEAPPSRLWLAKTLALTRRHDVSFNGAAYHSIVVPHDGQFVTADARYVNRAKREPARSCCWRSGNRPPAVAVTSDRLEPPMRTEAVLARVRSYPPWVKVALAINGLALLIGTSTHVTARCAGGGCPITRL